MLMNIDCVMIALKAYLLIRVCAHRLQLRQLFTADTLELMQFFCGLLVLFLRLMLFCH